jgi:flavin reductase (DIM6/NTAB) family NADH-FMN oxidoreductase RutF
MDKQSRPTPPASAGSEPAQNTSASLVSPGAVDTIAYRNLMRHQAGGVAIISCGKPGGRTGLTATAVCSISDAPPTLLICVNRNASGHKIITAERCFVVNFLAIDQMDLAKVFSGKAGLDGESRFSAEHWTTLATGAPVLRDAVANLDCEVVDEHGFETHSLFIGRVRAGTARDEADPLVYLRGVFCQALARP